MNYSCVFPQLSKGKVENQYDKGMSLMSLCVFLAIPSWPISFIMDVQEQIKFPEGEMLYLIR